MQPSASGNTCGPVVPSFVIARVVVVFMPVNLRPVVT
jgi:hypothetical protein